ncbi:DUF4129 domain-containing transglutaminase family protein [Sediminibacillus massiliensis]|uniref:DUF4129 domain-containing transglutaminase family protein n=1 Tax=Sediminibacillus massiliensis TaxID=1926277 RepID=UPI0009886C71|nr:transglutaminase domain-containing protein [Sediminibacillus massiliensis]
MDGFIRHYQPLLYQTVIYLCGFLLLWEWLRPLDTVTETGSLSVFVIYTAFCFLISMLRIKWWLSTPLKLIGLLFVLDGLFISEQMFSKAWFYLVYLHMQFNIEMMANQQWIQITPLFRSLLFLLLLWLMSYLLYYWFVVAKRVFFFILLTFIYLTVLDTFTTYRADTAIVRTFAISLIALGINNFYKELGKEAMPLIGAKKMSAWILPLIAVVFFSSIVGYAAPKLDPQWPDPVPYLTSTSDSAGFNEGGGNGVQKVGYGEDDTRLGGSFIQDNATVFYAEVQESHYWRIESKDVYTGKGWERSAEPEYEQTGVRSIDSTVFDKSAVETERREGSVSFERNAFFSKLVYPYGLDSVAGADDVNYLLDRTSGAIAVEGPERQAGEEYQVSYDSPSFSIDVLEEAGGDDPQNIKDMYLQLPDGLPRRVGNLANQIVSEEETRYGKVKAVEQYFGQNGFAYRTTDVAVPNSNQDYVDQFLFETKVGYCDNYSTSMVVLLRSLDIPARWVKGFTGGEPMQRQGDTPENLDRFEVTNSNAHSWVEAYFPGIGWVPFEPTQGFSNPIDFYEDREENESVAASSPEEQEEEELPANHQEIGGEEEESSTVNSAGSEASVSWTWLIWIGGVLVLGITLYYTRYRWMTYILLNKYKKRNDAKTYQDAYHYLLKILSHKGIVRKEGQTLREYARDVDHAFQSTEMSRLTQHYERLIYRNDQDQSQWNKVTELWENLIKQALS